MKRTLLQILRAGPLGLACAFAASLTPAVQAQILGTNEIAFSDYDNYVPGGNYGYFYQWNDGGARGSFTQTRSFSDPLIDPANGPLVYQFTFENIQYEGPVASDGCGYGAGFGMTLNWGYDPSVFTQMQLENYLLSFDARVEGLKPDQTTANCEMQFRLVCSAAIPTRVLQRNITYYPGSNWAHFVFTLDAGTYGGDGADPEHPTSYTTFTNGIALGITGIEFNQNQHMPHDQFGFDADNAIYLDNVRLQVIDRVPPPPPPPTVAKTILEWNFDDKPVSGGSGGWGWSETVAPSGTYSFGTNAAGTLGVVNDLGVGGSTGWYLQMDNTALTPPPAATWSGIGMNVWGLVENPQWTSPDLADYQISFDCRVEGLAADILTTTVSGKIFLNAPDDTMQPPDANTADDTVVGLQFTVPAETNWQTFKATLKTGTASDGSSKTNFPLYFSQISGVTGQFQVENLHQGSEWNYDTDNLLVVDNFKVERLYTGCPPLTIVKSGDDVVLSWAALNTVGYAQVQKATSVNGPYVDVPGATNSPVTLPAANGGAFFRTQWVSGQ